MVNNRRPMGDVYNCIPQEMVIENVRLAAAYIPFQQMCDIFNPIESLKKGTAFPELYSPYEPRDTRYKALISSDVNR